MRWTEPSARLSRLGGSAAPAAVNAVLHRRRGELNRMGVADLPGDRQLIGLEDTACVASFVPDLGAEAICVLTISQDSSPASTSFSARPRNAVEDVR